MGEVNAEVIKISKIENHPNADTLQIITVYDGYPVIIKKDSFKVGDLAIYVGVDACVPLSDNRFSFLKKPRIKAIKLRGIFSMGLIVPILDGEKFEEGKDVSNELGITRWQPDQDQTLSIVGNNIPDPGYMPHYDLEGLLKYKEYFQDGEEIVIHEKIEGQNGRALYHPDDDQLYVAAHSCYKKYDPDKLDYWWRPAIEYDFENKLKTVPYIAIYFESYGEHGIYTYGHKKGDCPSVAVFDAKNVKTQRWLDYDDLVALCDKINLPMAPEIHRGLWSASWDRQYLNDNFADGVSVLYPAHNREGCVIRTVKNRWVYSVGRMILKMKGETYLLGKENKKQSKKNIVVIDLDKLEEENRNCCQ